MRSLDIDNDKEAVAYSLEKVEVFPDEVGTLLKFEMDVAKYGIPEYAEAWVGVRDSRGQFVKGSEPFVDDDGDFLTNAEIVNGKWAVYIPTGALAHAAEGVYNVCSIVVSDDPEDEDYGLVSGYVNHNVMLPAPCKWDVVEWLRPMIDLCGLLARVAGFETDEEFTGLAENFADWFEYGDFLDVAKVAQALRKPSDGIDVSEAAMSIPLRMPELMPENVVATLLSLFDIPLENHDKLEGSAKAEAAFVKKVADIYGIRGSRWKELLSTFQDIQTAED